MERSCNRGTQGLRGGRERNKFQQAFEVDHSAGVWVLSALNRQTDLMDQFESIMEDANVMECPGVKNTMVRHALDFRLALAKAKGEREALGLPDGNR
jgi:hypothetical protein